MSPRCCLGLPPSNPNSQPCSEVTLYTCSHCQVREDVCVQIHVVHLTNVPSIPGTNSGVRLDARTPKMNVAIDVHVSVIAAAFITGWSNGRPKPACFTVNCRPKSYYHIWASRPFRNLPNHKRKRKAAAWIRTRDKSLHVGKP